MEIGLCFIPPDLATTARVAGICEDAGVGWFGVCDTPYLYAEPHAAIQTAIGATRTMRIGTFVTNPVTRHWSVQAAAFRAHWELAPGRVYLGIGPGDSAVHTGGLRPASPAALAEYVTEVRAHTPEGLEIMVAAGGPKSVRAAAAYADHLVIGQGASEGSVQQLGAIAGSIERTNPHPLKTWLFLLLCVSPSAEEARRVESDVRSIVVAYSRQAFDRTYEGKDVPERLHEPLRRLYAGYTFDEHSKPGDSSNARLLSDQGGREVEEFLFQRFALTGEPEAAAERLQEIVERTGIDRVFLSSISSDPIELARLAGARFFPRLTLRGS